MWSLLSWWRFDRHFLPVYFWFILSFFHRVVQVLPALALETLRKSGPLTVISNHEGPLGYSEEGPELSVPCGLSQTEPHPIPPHPQVEGPHPAPSLFLCMQGDLGRLSTGLLSTSRFHFWRHLVLHRSPSQLSDLSLHFPAETSVCCSRHLDLGITQVLDLPTVSDPRAPPSGHDLQSFLSSPPLLSQCLSSSIFQTPCLLSFWCLSGSLTVPCAFILSFTSSLAPLWTAPSPGSLVPLPPDWGLSRCPHARPLPPGCQMLRGLAGWGYCSRLVATVRSLLLFHLLRDT